MDVMRPRTFDATEDTDASCTESLIQHLPLEDVIAFVNARDEVRRIRVPLAERADEPGDRPTMRVIGLAA